METGTVNHERVRSSEVAIANGVHRLYVAGHRFCARREFVASSKIVVLTMT